MRFQGSRELRGRLGLAREVLLFDLAMADDTPLAEPCLRKRG
jgi:hypothetical protein